MDRRQLIKGLVPIYACSAGCADIAVESGPDDTPDDREELISVESTPVSVDAATVEQTSYELDRNTTFRLTQTISVGDESYLIQAVNDLIEYKRSAELPQIGAQDIVRFTAVSTPEVEAFSQEVDFVDQVTTEAMGNGLQSAYENVEVDDEPVETHTITPFAHETQVSRHDGIAEIDGHTIEIFVHVTETFNESDYVTLVGVYPRSLVDEEQELVLRMMEAVQMEEST